MKEKKLLSFIKKTIVNKGESPTFSEMKKAIGVNSISSIYRSLDLLKEQGFIRQGKGWRGITLAKDYEEDSMFTKIPLLGTVAAGNPIEAVLVLEHVVVPSDMLTAGHNHFALRAQGDSMIEESIAHGDKIVLRESATAANRDIVVALIDGSSATLKRFNLIGNRVQLIPANKNYEIIEVEADRVTIQGVVVGLLRYFK